MDEYRKKKLVWVSAASALMVSGLAMATETQVEPLQERPKPPQVALDACLKRAVGDACSVDFHGKTLTGTCRKLPEVSDALVCLPDGPPPGAPPR